MAVERLSVVLMTVFNSVALNGKLFDAVPRVTTAAGTVVAANRSASMLSILVFVQLN